MWDIWQVGGEGCGAYGRWGRGLCAGGGGECVEHMVGGEGVCGAYSRWGRGVCVHLNICT